MLGTMAGIYILYILCSVPSQLLSKVVVITNIFISIDDILYTEFKGHKDFCCESLIE